jgi:hypothetical protein
MVRSDRGELTDKALGIERAAAAKWRPTGQPMAASTTQAVAWHRHPVRQAGRQLPRRRGNRQSAVARISRRIGLLAQALKATTPKRISTAPRTTYQRRHHGLLDDGPVGGGDPQPAGGCGGGSQPSGGPAGGPQPGPYGGDVPFAGGCPGGGGGPQPSGLTHRSGMAPRSPNPDNSSVRYKRSRRPDRYADSDRRPWAGDSNSGPPPEVVPGGGCAGGLTCDS